MPITQREFAALKEEEAAGGQTGSKDRRCQATARNCQPQSAQVADLQGDAQHHPATRQMRLTSRVCAWPGRPFRGENRVAERSATWIGAGARLPARMTVNGIVPGLLSRRLPVGDGSGTPVSPSGRSSQPVYLLTTCRLSGRSASRSRSARLTRPVCHGGRPGSTRGWARPRRARAGSHGWRVRRRPGRCCRAGRGGR